MAIRYKRPRSARLKKLLSYDPETGIFIRIFVLRAQVTPRYVGKVAGTIKKGSQSSGGGYRIIEIDGHRYRAHHLAWLYMTGKWPKSEIDHRDGERDNNRWVNLREATRSQNLGNARIPSTNKSGLKGACFDKSRGKWLAQIVIRGVHYHLGRYDTAEEAAEAYKQAALEHHGEFARFT